MDPSAIHEDRIKRDWPQLAASLKARWDKLTDEDLRHGDGNRDYLTDRLRERYRVPWDEANRHVREFEDTLRASAASSHRRENR